MILQEKVSVKVPGKLMVAGEYAVLEPNQPLIVMAVNRYVYCTVEQQEKGKLHLPNLNLNEVDWDFCNNKILLNHDDQRLNFVKNSLELSMNFLCENGHELSPFSLSVHSELDDNSGKKYGLGSSAAVVTAVTSAILQLFDCSITKDTIFKIAAMAHTVTQQSGSGADVAASTYGGVMKYTSFQSEWLLEKMSGNFSVKKIVEGDWPYYSRYSLQFPEGVQVFVGWTGKPASTTNLVKEVKKLKRENEHLYETFLQNSQVAVDTIVKGMEENNAELFFEGIKSNRIALARLGENANVKIETEKLHKLSLVTEELSGAGKLSGAGGGDCGLGFVPVTVGETTLKTKWEKSDIVPLTLAVCHKGAEVLDV